jgi:hypothetical protein
MPDVRMTVEAGTPEVVAFRLMTRIGDEEKVLKAPDQHSRGYWLTLYAECLGAVKGETPGSSPATA